MKKNMQIELNSERKPRQENGWKWHLKISYTETKTIGNCEDIKLYSYIHIFIFHK